jgi:4-azaleucine resistance transporter AzlC
LKWYGVRPEYALKHAEVQSDWLADWRVPARATNVEDAIESQGYRRGARAVAPLAVAVFGFGVSFGALARAAGFGWVSPIVMSATTFAGSAQFAAVSILGDGGTVAAAVTAALLLNARYGPIGVSVAPWLRGPVWSRFLRGQLVVDESWVVAAEGEGRFDPHVLVGAGVVLFAAWVVGTAIGAVGGEALGDPTALGLDAAFPALFLALLIPQVRGRRPLVAALLGAAIALALTPVAPAGVPIIAAAAACLLGVRR